MAGARGVALPVLLLLVAPLLATALSDKGIVYLDDLTFDKIVNGREDVLVRFDKEYPWGDAHEMYKELAQTIGEADAPLVVAGVPISNRDEYLVNPKLSRRFKLDSLKDDDLPKFRLFLKGGDPKKPVAYTGAPKKEDMAAWLVVHANVFIGLKGQIEALDAAARKLMAAKARERPGLLKKAQDEAAAIDLTPAQKDYAEYYIKTMARVVEKGEEYVQKEFQRLSKIASDKAVAAAKRETFEWKANVLSSFRPKGTAAGGGDKTEL